MDDMLYVRAIEQASKKDNCMGVYYRGLNNYQYFLFGGLLIFIVIIMGPKTLFQLLRPLYSRIRPLASTPAAHSLVPQAMGLGFRG